MRNRLFVVSLCLVLLLIAHSGILAEPLPWSPRTAFNPGAKGDNDQDMHPKILADRSGTWLASWDTLDGGGDILFTRSVDGAETWYQPQLVHDFFLSSPNFNGVQDMSTDGRENWMITWREFRERSFYLSMSHNNAETWHEPQVFTHPTAEINPQLWFKASIGENSTALAVLQKDDSAPAVYRSTDAGITWEETAQPPVSGGFLGSMVSTGWERWGILWYPRESDDAVKFSRSSDNGLTWSSPTNVGSATAESLAVPGLESLGGGKVVAVWKQAEKLMFSRSEDYGESWSSPQMLFETSLTVGHAPQIEHDQWGNVIIVWSVWDGPDFDIYYTWSKDWGATWDPARVLAYEERYDAYRDTMPDISTDQRGRWITLWYSTLFGGGGEWGDDLDIFASQLDMNGGPVARILWPRTDQCVSGNRVLVAAETDLPDSVQESDISVNFQYRSVGSAEWLPIPAANVNHPNPDADSPFFMHWDVTGLTAGDYEVRAVAATGGGSSAIAPANRIHIDSNCANTLSDSAGGNTRAEGRLSPDNPLSLAVGSGDGSTMMRLFVPRRLAQSERSIQLFTLPVDSLKSRVSIGGGYEIVLDGATLWDEGTFDLVFNYADADDDGFPDGTAMSERGLRLYRLGEGKWDLVTDAQLDTSNNEVRLRTNQAGVYALFLIPAPAEATGWRLE